MAIIIRANGATETVEPKNGKDFKLDELQAIVGGCIEIHKMRDDRIMVMDEDGYSKRKPINSEATFEFSQNVTFGIIVGDVLVCEARQVC